MVLRKGTDAGRKETTRQTDTWIDSETEKHTARWVGRQAGTQTSVDRESGS